MANLQTETQGLQDEKEREELELVQLRKVLNPKIQFQWPWNVSLDFHVAPGKKTLEKPLNSS